MRHEAKPPKQTTPTTPTKSRKAKGATRLRDFLFGRAYRERGLELSPRTGSWGRATSSLECMFADLSLVATVLFQRVLLASPLWQSCLVTSAWCPFKFFQFKLFKSAHSHVSSQACSGTPIPLLLGIVPRRNQEGGQGRRLPTTSQPGSSTTAICLPHFDPSPLRLNPSLAHGELVERRVSLVHQPGICHSSLLGEYINPCTQASRGCRGQGPVKDTPG